MRGVETKEEKYVSYYLLTILASKRGVDKHSGETRDNLETVNTFVSSL